MNEKLTIKLYGLIDNDVLYHYRGGVPGRRLTFGIKRYGIGYYGDNVTCSLQAHYNLCMPQLIDEI